MPIPSMPDDYPALLEKARQQYEAAFHLLHVTFPLVKDSKLLLGVVNNIFSSLEYSMSAILNYERQLHLVPHYFDNFQSKLNLFRYKSVRRNNIPMETVNLMMELKALLELHKKSPMEFQRGGRLVICSQDYHLRTLSIKDLHVHLARAKELLNQADNIIKIDRKQ